MLRKILLPTIFALLAYGFWASADFKEIAAGIAIFLFGMLSLEEGFRAFTGGTLEQLLRRATDRLWKSLSFGIVATTLMQSSSLVSVITISFLSAGLLGLSEGIGVVFGANLGTTTGAWLIAGFGLKVKLSVYAMPMLVFGVILILQRQKALRGIGYALAGLGFLFLGIHHMKEGFEAFKGTIDLTRFALPGFFGVMVFSLVGITATVIMQSSHATLVLTITALAAGQITYDNALALAIGANIGTTGTAILGALGANVQGRRLAGAHLIFNLATGAIAIVFIYQLVWLVDALAGVLGIPATDYALKLAVFHTLFNLLGIVLMVPLIGRLVNLLCRVIKAPKTTAEAPAHLVRAAIEFPDTAVEAVRKESIHIYENALRIITHALGLSRKELLSGEDLERLIANRDPPSDFDVDAEYQAGVKTLYAAVIVFISRAAFGWQQAQSQRLHWLRDAGRDLVEAVKALKHLQKNLLAAARSSNPNLRREYQRVRVRVLSLLRELEQIRRIVADDVTILSLDALKLEVAAIDREATERIYRLINEERISPAMATSLINDYGYACAILNNMIAAGSSIFVASSHELAGAQHAIRLTSEELDQVGAEGDHRRVDAL